MIQVSVKVAKFSPIPGSADIDLLFRIREIQNVINIRNDDDQSISNFAI